MDLTLHSWINWVTFQGKVLWSAPLWVDYLYESLNRQALLSRAYSKDTVAFCWPSRGCNNFSDNSVPGANVLGLFLSKPDWNRWSDFHILLMLLQIWTPWSEYNMFSGPCWCSVMIWAQATYCEFFSLTCSLWCIFKNTTGPFFVENLVRYGGGHVTVLVVVFMPVISVLCLSAEMCYHLLTWTKTMPYLKPPTIILQKRNSHRRHPLPWYTPTHKYLI